MDLDCGIAMKRIVAWLDEELGLVRDGGGWIYRCEVGICRITASALESRRLGLVSLERTLVCVEGPDAAIEDFMKLFTLRFISAGG